MNYNSVVKVWIIYKSQHSWYLIWIIIASSMYELSINHSNPDGSSGHSWYLIWIIMRRQCVTSVSINNHRILMEAQNIPDFSWTIKNDNLSNHDIDLLRPDGFLIMDIMILLWCIIIMIKNTFSGLMHDMPQMPSQRQSFRLFWQSLSDRHFATQLKKWK